jgi:hypothetical protein
MNPNASHNPSRPMVSPDDTLKSVAQGTADLDAQRAAAYGNLAIVRAAKSGVLLRSKRLLAMKLGENDPRVLAYDDAIAVNEGVRAHLDLGRASAAVPTPSVNATTYVFHGFVRNSQRAPLPDLTVATYDNQDRFFAPLGYACTAPDGHFELRYPTASTSQQPNPATSERTNPFASASPPSLQVRVYDQNQKLLHQEATPLQPGLGQIDYREIIVSCGGTCTPPPGSTPAPPPVPPRPTAKPPPVPVTKPPPTPTSSSGPTPRPAPTPTPSPVAKGSKATAASRQKATGGGPSASGGGTA